MREQIERRLQSLMAEYKAGQEMAVELEARQAQLNMTMARITGAIQVLEELLHQDATDGQLPESAAMLPTSVAA